MLSRALVPFALACAAIGGVPAALAQPRPGAASAPPNEVRAWLLRIHDAASRRNFQGTFVVSGGGGVANARISHFHDGPNQYERIESLDGRQRKVFRHNDVVHTLWPASKVAMIEQRGQLSSFPALLQAGDDALAEWYEVQREAPDRVAGHETDVLVVKPRDSHRYGYRIVRPALTPTRLEDEGWSMRPATPGFRFVSCVRRQMEMPGETGDASAAPVIQTIYSDGLTYVSVFIERYRADRHTEPMFVSLGATVTFGQRQGDWWVTVVGDTPPSTLKTFAAALERKKP